MISARSEVFTVHTVCEGRGRGVHRTSVPSGSSVMRFVLSMFPCGAAGMFIHRSEGHSVAHERYTMSGAQRGALYNRAGDLRVTDRRTWTSAPQPCAQDTSGNVQVRGLQLSGRQDIGNA